MENRTLADVELAGYENDLTVEFQGNTYPVFVLIEALLKITDKNGKCIPFHLNKQQCLLYKQMCEQRRSGKPIRQNILKARQIGFSTFIAGVLFIITMFTPNVKSAVIADIADHAQNIFDKYNFFYEHLDDSNPNYEIIQNQQKEKGKNFHSNLSYKPVLKYSQGKTLMQTLYGNSSLEVLVAGVSAGRSATYQYVHISECAFFPNLKVTLNGLLDTVPNENKNSMVFLETTANGFNNYKDRWDVDYAGGTPWNACFVPWFTNPAYSKPEYETKPRPRIEEWLEDKQRKYQLSDAQIMWYWDKYADKSFDKNDVLQEYPFCPVDAFITSGNCIFNAELVANREKEVIENSPIKKRGIYHYVKQFSTDGRFIKLLDQRFETYEKGSIIIFKEPEKGHPYVGVCDPNNGGSDDTAISIFDNHTLEQVAVFKTNDMPLDEVAYQFYLLGRYYNDALLTNEMNIGKTVMEVLIKLNYPKLYIAQSQAFDNYTQSIKTMFGHKTTKENRSWAIESFREAFRENPKMINDYTTLTQMASFQRVEHISKTGAVTRKDEATSGNHDDCVAVCWGFFIVRSQQTTLIDNEREMIENGVKNYNNEYFTENKRTSRTSKLTRITGIKR